MPMRTSILAVAFLTFSPLLHSQEPPDRMIIYPGFMKAQNFLNLSEGEQNGYAEGFVDGLFVAPYFGGPQPNKLVAAMADCMNGMTNVQVAAIIAKHIRDEPSQWHRPLNPEALSAITNACPAMRHK
jgi:hypothetical protein